MKKIILINTLSSLMVLVFIAGLSTCTYPAYALPAHPHGESGLVTRSTQDAQAAFNAVFCCVPFGYAHVMARLEGDTFACAGFLCVPVDQPPSVLPPSFGHERQDFFHTQGVSHD